MRHVFILVCLLSTSSLCRFGRAQEPIPQTHTEQNSCDSLNGIVPDEVKNAASSLSVCRNLQRILSRREIISSDSYRDFVAKLQLQTENPSPITQAQDEATRLQDLQDRQQIAQAVNRSMLDSNLVLLRAHTAMLELQGAAMNAEQRAFRRTKLLNAFLGTTVGAIGSGMQFSSNTSVQHAGDGVSVAGGAITAVFALCTADINVIDPPPDPLSQAFQTNNQQRIIPDTVWNYVKKDPSFSDIVQAAPEPTKEPPRVFSCHLTQAPKLKTEARIKFLNSLDDSLIRMSQATAELSRLSAQ
jgi:hypothetical protein